MDIYNHFFYFMEWLIHYCRTFIASSPPGLSWFGLFYIASRISYHYLYYLMNFRKWNFELLQFILHSSGLLKLIKIFPFPRYNLKLIHIFALPRYNHNSPHHHNHHCHHNGSYECKPPRKRGIWRLDRVEANRGKGKID